MDDRRAALMWAATALLLLASCAASMKDILVRQGFSYPFHVSRKVSDALELRRGGRCEAADANRALLSDGRTKVSDALLERVAWRYCPAGAEAAMFHGPFVYVKGGEPVFAMTLSCFGTEEPAPGYYAASAKAAEGEQFLEPARLVDGWDLAPMGTYWEARNVALFRPGADAFEFQDMLAHYSRTRELAALQRQPGDRSELLAALTCSSHAEVGQGVVAKPKAETGTLEEQAVPGIEGPGDAGATAATDGGGVELGSSSEDLARRVALPPAAEFVRIGERRVRCKRARATARTARAEPGCRPAARAFGMFHVRERELEYGRYLSAGMDTGRRHVDMDLTDDASNCDVIRALCAVSGELVLFVAGSGTVLFPWVESADDLATAMEWLNVQPGVRAVHYSWAIYAPQ